jgi:hypothetical protein
MGTLEPCAFRRRQVRLAATSRINSRGHATSVPRGPRRKISADRLPQCGNIRYRPEHRSARHVCTDGHHPAPSLPSTRRPAAVCRPVQRHGRPRGRCRRATEGGRSRSLPVAHSATGISVPILDGVSRARSAS